MAKAASPVRLQQELMQAASSAGRRWHRSAAEQIEYWASIGRNVSKSVNPDKLLAINAGLAQLKVVPVHAPVIEADDVFAALEQERTAGTLAASVVNAEVRYQASTAHPGYLEQLGADGTITIGQFAMGKFTPLKR